MTQRDTASDLVIQAARSAEPARAVIATDASGIIIFWNEGAEELYGWSADEVVGKHVLDVTPTISSQSEAAEIMRRLSAGEAWSGQFIVRHRKGNPLVVHVRDVPVFDGDRFVGVVGESRPWKSVDDGKPSRQKYQGSAAPLSSSSSTVSASSESANGLER